MAREGLKVVFVDANVIIEAQRTGCREALVGDIMTRNGELYSGVYTRILSCFQRQPCPALALIDFHNGVIMTGYMRAVLRFLPLLLLALAQENCHAQSGWFWQHPLPQGHNLYAVSFFNANLGLAVGDAGTILRTTDAGTTWTRQESGSTRLLYGVAFLDAMHAVAVGNYGYITRSTDGGTHWIMQTEVTSQTLKDIRFHSNTGIIVGSYGTILRSDDGGASWIEQVSGTTYSLNAITFCSAEVAVAVGDGGLLLRSTDGGGSWSP